MASAALLEEGALPPHPQQTVAHAVLEQVAAVPHSITQLQWVLKLAHSHALVDQQKAAMELSTMIEGTTLFPLVSFAPMAHSLSKLLPSPDRTVAYYSARAIKTLLLDDALRSQALMVGLPAVLVTALHTWHEELPCLREILAALQTLSCDRHTVQAILVTPAATTTKDSDPSPTKATISSTETQGKEEEAAAVASLPPPPSQKGGALLPVLALLEARDQEVLTLCLAIVANVCAYSDTVLLAHQDLGHALCEAFPAVLTAAQSRDRLLRCYGMAALANASANPVLAGKIKELDGVAVIEKVEKENLSTLTFGGTRITECCEVALLRLMGVAKAMEKEKEGSKPLSTRKFLFKWGTTPSLELTLDGSKNRAGVVGCLVLWIVCVLVVLQPVLRPGNTGSHNLE